MSHSGQQPRVEVQLQERTLSDAHDALTVDRVWLPMCVWEDVRVEMRTTRGLTIMERFVIECLLRLDGCDSADLQEIAAIGPELSKWLLISCLQKSLARRDRNRFFAERHACEQALERNELPHQVERRVDILCFPETDEFVLLDDFSHFLRQFRQLQPSGNYPLPIHWERSERGELLSRAREEGRLYGNAANTCVVFHDGAVMTGKQCPAYQASVELRDAAETDWVITLIGHCAQKKKLLPASNSENHQRTKLAYVRVRLPALPQLKRRWQMLFAAVEEKLRDELQKVGLGRIERRGAMWMANVDAAAADALAADRLLTLNMELAVQLDREVEFSAPLELVPSANASRQAFARDNVVRQVLSAPKERVVAVATEDPNVTLADVRGRLWQLKLFGAVYQLRQEEDFAP